MVDNKFIQQESSRYTLSTPFHPGFVLPFQHVQALLCNQRFPQYESHVSASFIKLKGIAFQFDEAGNLLKEILAQWVSANQKHSQVD